MYASIILFELCRHEEDEVIKEMVKGENLDVDFDNVFYFSELLFNLMTLLCYEGA